MLNEKIKKIEALRNLYTRYEVAEDPQHVAEAEKNCNCK